MGYRWKPNKAQRLAYSQSMQERENYNFIQSKGAIRVGCIIKWLDKSSAEVLEGLVINSSYGFQKSQHTFTVCLGGATKLVKGRNLYDSLLSHIPGEVSKEVSIK